MALVSEAEFLKQIAPSLRRPLRLGEFSPTGCDVFDYDFGQPNLFLLMRFKQALVREFGVEQGFQIYRDTVAAQSDARLSNRALASQSTFAGTESLFFKELAPAGQRFIVDPPTVLGPGDHRPLVGTTRSFYVACFRDARVTGRSELVQSCGTWLLDRQPAETALLDDEIEFDGQVFSANPSGSCIIESGERRTGLEFDEAFHLLGAHTDFFGHWMWEYLPRLAAALLSGALPPVPMLIDAHMPRSHRQSLELVVSDGAPIVEVRAFENVFVRRLWCAPNLMYMPVHEKMNDRFRWDYMALPAERFAPVLQELNRRIASPLRTATGPKRVFLARKPSRHRKLVNSREIELLAAQRQFVIVYPEDLDFPGQIALVHDAEYVIAPEGSALFLCFFIRERAKICILNHPFTEGLTIYKGLLASKDIEITVVSGPAVKLHHELRHYADYRIDEREFSEFLDRWLCDR